MCTAWYWIVNHLDRILALLAIVIAAVAIVDVHRLFEELGKRGRDTGKKVRHAVLMELLTHTSSLAAYSRAAQFIEFDEDRRVADLCARHRASLQAQLELAGVPNSSVCEGFGC
jgi:hypothetical protein